MRQLVSVVVVIGTGGAAGCASLLGLESTSFDQMDAPGDAPSVCDGAPLCTVTTGRSVCGQLFGTGDTAGMPFRTATPTKP